MPREPHWLEQRYKDIFPKRFKEPLNGTRPNATMPADLSRYVAAAFKGVISDLRKATEGDRNTQLNISAYRLGRLISGMQLDENVARAFLEESARAIGLERDETSKTIQSGIEAGKLEPYTPDGNDYLDPADAIDLVNVSVPSLSSSLVDWSVVLDPNRVDVNDWIIEGIVERGQLCVLYAPPKTHKSLIVQWLCAEIVRQHTVLYLDFENTEKDLFRRFGPPGMQRSPEQLTRLKYAQFPPLTPLDTVAGGAMLVAWVDECRPDLVVIDTTSRVVSGPENDSDTFRALYNRTLVHIKALGIGILRIDHSGKDVALGQRGSSAKNDDVDAVWQLIKQSDEIFVLRCTHQRTGHHPDVITLHKEIGPLRFVRSMDAAISAGPLSTEQLAMEMDRLKVPLSVSHNDIHHFVRNIGLNVSQRAAQRARQLRKDRVENAALVMSDLSESLAESKIKSLDQQLPNHSPNHSAADSNVFPASGPNHSTESLRITPGAGVPEAPESLTGGPIRPPVIRGADAQALATVLSVFGKNVSIVECALKVSPTCTGTSGLIDVAGQSVCKPCAYERGKNKRCCKGTGYLLNRSCMDCSLFGSAIS